MSTRLESIRIAVHAIGRRPVRSALNALTAAVAIGTVVTSMALIAGSRAVFENDMRALGLLTVQVHADPLAVALGRAHVLTDEDVEGVRAAARTLAAEVVPARVLQFSARAGERPAALLPVVATRPGYLHMHEGRVGSGRWLTAADSAARRPRAVLDAQAAVVLFGRVDVVGESVALVRADERLTVEVIGVLEDPFTMRKQYEQFDTTRGARHIVARLLSFQNVYVPLDLLPDRPYTTILSRARDRDGARRLGRALREWSEARETPLFVWSRGEWVDSVIEVVSDFSMLGSVLWALVLLVAMVMIFAVTTVSVRERYPEVAIRRTEGATRGDILVQFVVEGVVLSLAGGLAGLALGVVSAHVLSGIVDWPPAFRPGDMALALGLAVLVGLGASALPARRASRLDPVVVLSRRRL